jgi:hypothetical protein
MGRYYETAKPTFVDDVIYQAPYELIARALESKDLQVEEDEVEIDEVGVLSDDKKYTEQDKEKRNQVVNGYRTEIDNIAKKIQENPEHRNYYMRRIDTARKKFDKDISTGFLNDADRNFTLREESRAKINARKDINDEQRSVALAQLDHDFKGSDSEKGNLFSDNMHIYEALDEEKFIKDKKVEITANSITTKTNRTDGRYFTTDTGVRKFISDSKLDDSFENSTGVGKWEKALLQKLDWQVQQKVISKDTMDETFRRERELFKQDYIKSLAFEQTSTADGILSRDGTFHADQANAIAWTRLNKEDNLATQDTQIDGEDITVANKSQENLTNNETLMVQYNQEGKRIKAELGDNYSAIEAGLSSSDKDVRRQSLEALKSAGYSPKDMANLRGYVANKKREYKAVKTKSERKNYLVIANSTPDNAMVSVKYTKDGVDVIEEMPLYEARILSQDDVQQKVKKEGPASMTYKGQKVAAYKGSGGKMIPITTVNKEPVPIDEYSVDGEYSGGRKATIVKTDAIETVKKPYTISDATVTTSEINKKYDNPYASPTSTSVVNYHKITGGREIIISIPIDSEQANILNKSK